MAKVIFMFKGIQTIIQCLKEDKMETICKKFTTKVDQDINTLCFIYNGTQINLKLSFEQQANNLDKDSNTMNVFVSEIDQDKIICPKCGEKFNFDRELLNKLTSSNNNINDILVGLQIQVDNMINNKQFQNNINLLNIQLKNINLFINNAISDIKNIEKHIKYLINFNQNNTQMKINNKNIIEGILDINMEDIQNGIILFNRERIEGIDAYINNKKINLINENNKWKIYENIINGKNGKNKFKIIFNNSLTTLYRFFNECTSLYSIDLSNLDTSNVVDFGWMFNGCNKLKEIKGLNNLNTSKVNSI